jgi:hypothetical protein
MFESKDSLALTTDILSKLFKKDERINYQTFEERMIANNLHWIFSPHGIRSQFELMNQNSADS